MTAKRSPARREHAGGRHASAEREAARSESSQWQGADFQAAEAVIAEEHRLLQQIAWPQDFCKPRRKRRATTRFDPAVEDQRPQRAPCLMSCSACSRSSRSRAMMSTAELVDFVCGHSLGLRT